MITAPVVLVGMLASAMAFAAYAPTERAEVSSSEESSSAYQPSYSDSPYLDTTIVFNDLNQDDHATAFNVYPHATPQGGIQVADGYMYGVSAVTFVGGDISSYQCFRLECRNFDDVKDTYLDAYLPFIVGRYGNNFAFVGSLKFFWNGPSTSSMSVQDFVHSFTIPGNSAYSVYVGFDDALHETCFRFYQLLNEGYNDGYSVGYSDGSAVAPSATDAYYRQGYSAGYSAGYEQGKADGRVIGYNEGKSAVSNSATGIMTLFGAVANIPISVLNGIGTLVIFDVPIIQILATFLIIALFMWVIKKVV